MNTTDIFIELLIIGIQGVIGLLPLVFGPHRFILFLRQLTTHWVIGIPLLAMAYVLGILIDRLADGGDGSPFMLKVREKKLRTFLREVGLPTSPSQMRLTILKACPEIYERLEFSDSRLRIARSSVPNFIVMTVSYSWLAYELPNPFIGHASFLSLIAPLVMGAILICLSYNAVNSLTDSLMDLTVRGYGIVNPQDQEKIKVYFELKGQVGRKEVTSTNEKIAA